MPKIESIGNYGTRIRLIIFTTHGKRRVFKDLGEVDLFQSITPGQSVKKIHDSANVGIGITNTITKIEPVDDHEEEKFILKTAMYRECEVTLL